MSQQELLTRVVQSLDALQIDYMLTGSLASSLQGEPRSTHDIDLVVDFRSLHVTPLLEHFPEPAYYLSEAAMREAIAQGRMFNLLEIENGEKADFWLLKLDEFDQARFGRRIRDDVDGLPVWVSTPEDTILAKLRWAKMSGGSEKQMNDSRHVYELQFHVIDHEYLRVWADRLDVTELLKQIQREAVIVDPDDV